jgi:hypothetical protein
VFHAAVENENKKNSGLSLKGRRNRIVLSPL